MLTRVHSAIIEVVELDAAVRDYARLIGFEPTRRERDQAGRRSAFFVFANVALELREIATEGAAPARPGQAGLRLAWEGPDPRVTLAERGVDVEATTSGRAEDEGEGPPRTWTAHRVARAASRQLPVELVADEEPAEVLAPGEVRPVAGAEDRATRIHALDHVVVMSPAPDATRAFYGDGLGIRLALDKTFDQRGVRLLFFRLAGLTIEIGARTGSAPAPEKADRFGGLAWRVPDVDAIRARLAADGFDVSEVRTGHKPGTRVCTVRDPVHGVPTLLIQPVQPV